MDIFVPIIICVVLFILFSVCGYCCKKHRGTVYGHSGTPIAVTQVTTTTGVHPPYPTNPLHPTPQSVSLQAPPPGFVPVGGYQAVPYPPVPVSGVYYPAPVGAAPGGAPYPPMNTPYPPTPYSPTQAVPPPSYSEAIGHNPVQPPPVQEQYAKQAPYNPNY